MKNCKYYFGDQEFEGLQALIDSFNDEDINKQLGILFSLDEADPQTNLADKLKNINKEYKYKVTKSSVDLNPDLDSENHYTIQNFIDSAYFYIDGQPPMFQLKVEDFLETQRDLWLKEGMSEEEVQNRAKFILKNWDRIAKDALDLHRIINGCTDTDSGSYFSGATLKTSFKPVWDQVQVLTEKIEKAVRMDNKNAIQLKNLNVEASLKEQAKKIIGHIDYCFIKDNGVIDIYNLKVSTDSESSWSAVKKDKFRHELAILKRILEYNGINAKNIRVNLVPVKLQYNDDFTAIQNIELGKVKPYDMYNGWYTMKKYDDVARQFIDSTIEMPSISNDVVTRIDNNLQLMFPYHKVLSSGVKPSIKEWVDSNWNTIAKSAKGGGWDILLPEENSAIHIDNTARGSNNTDVINLVESKLADTFDTESQQKSIERIIEDIDSSYEHGYDGLVTRSKSYVSTLVNAELKKYFSFSKKDSDGNPYYEWKMLHNDILESSGIIMFQNRNTGQIDLINISPCDVSIKKPYKTNNNLLGAYLSDMNNHRFTMESNYGNIEAMRTMEILNEILPKLPFEPILGDLKIIGMKTHKKQGLVYDMGLLLPEFNTVVEVIKENCSKANLENNFRKLRIKGLDPADAVVQTWRDYLNLNTSLSDLSEEISSHTLVDGTVVDGLETVKTTDAKIQKLESIIRRITEMADSIGLKLSPDQLQKYLKDTSSSNEEYRAIAAVYVQAVKALNKYYGDLHLENEEFSSISEYFFKPQSIPNTNVRTVAYMFQRSIDNIANNVMSTYQPIRNIILKYYKDKGYSAVQNSTLGNQASVYENLYELDLQGNRTMRFKNPYDDSLWQSKEDKIDQEFLKRILFELNKIRYQMHGLKFNFTGINDPKIEEKIVNENWLDVPLERASAATRRTNIKNGFIEFGKRVWRTITKPKETFREFEEGLLSKEDKQDLETHISNLQAYNPFMRSEARTADALNRRNTYIQKYGPDYFEYNLENIMVDFIEKHVQSVEYNKMLTRTKGVLLDLYLRGETEGDDKTIQHTVKTIEDFLSVSVFNKSIMEESSQAIEAYLAPIRHAVSTCYIAANPTGMVRDIVQGIMENTIRSLNHFQTKVNPNDIRFGYKEVISEGVTSVMSITKLNQLNLKFRISNLDVARISEGQKTGRSGLTNLDNIAYQTLRRPDYLNRMVLLVAQMHKDGCYDAYYINKDGELVYDYTRDERFKDYLSGDKSKPKYGEQRALYLNMLRQFNQERGLQLKEGDALPDAYTSVEIGTIKNVSDSIYGSYNQSTKAKYELVAIGRNFAFFSTWMNGIVDNYARKPQVSQSESEWVQRTENGEKLYFDDFGNIVPESNENANKNQPVMDLVPPMVQGIWYTLTQSYKELVRGEGVEGFKKNIWSNEKNRANFKKFGSDMFVYLLWGAIFKCFLSALYNDHKTHDDGKNVIANALMEITYKSTYNSFDGFKGPFAVLDYLGNSTNPATYKLQSKVINDLYGFVFGDKTFMQVAMGSQALPRSFKDTYTMWARDNGQ